MPRLFDGEDKPRRKRSRRSTRTSRNKPAAEPAPNAVAPGPNTAAPAASDTPPVEASPTKPNRAKRHKPRADAAPRVKGRAKKKAETAALNEQGESGKPGRPAHVFTEEDIETMQALVGGEGFTKEEIALYFGVSRDTIYERCDPDHATFDARISDAFAKGFLIARGNVGMAWYKGAADGSIQHIQSWMKRWGVYVDQTPQRVELTGRDGKPIETVSGPMSMEEIAARLRGFKDRQESTIANVSSDAVAGEGQQESAAA